MSNDFIYTTYIRSTPEKIWAAITNPEFTRQYWGDHINVSNWKKDSTWQHEDLNDNKAVRVEGRVLESNPPHCLVLTWFAPSDVTDSSTVTFEIEQVEDMVRLDVVHGKFKPESVMAGKVSKGWPLVLSSLKSYLETEKAIDILALKKGCSTN